MCVINPFNLEHTLSCKKRVFITLLQKLAKVFYSRSINRGLLCNRFKPYLKPLAREVFNYYSTNIAGDARTCKALASCYTSKSLKTIFETQEK